MAFRINPLTAALAVAFSTGFCHNVSAQEKSPAPQVLNDVVVSDSKIYPIPSVTAVSDNNLAPMRAATSDTASLLRDVPGVSLYSAGGASSLPVIHGMADDRLRVKIDEGYEPKLIRTVRGMGYVLEIID